MKKSIKHIIAVAMAVLMTVATFGTVAVSAADNTNPDFAVYFENEKNWKDVYAYVWNPETGEENAPWPGVKLELVGTTNFGTMGRSANEIYEFECDNTQALRVIFNEGFDHGQESSSIDIRTFFGSICLVGLDKDNNATIGHFIGKEYINLF